MKLYRTSHELSWLRGLYTKNRSAFLVSASMIMTDQRSYKGDGMDIDLKRLKRALSMLLRQHQEEFPFGYPPPQNPFTTLVPKSERR